MHKAILSQGGVDEIDCKPGEKISTIIKMTNSGKIKWPVDTSLQLQEGGNRRDVMINPQTRDSAVV